MIAGTVCMDKYEASVWQIPATNPTGGSNKGLITKIQKGTATLANLQAGGATQMAPAGECPWWPATFPENGQWTQPLYAISIPGVLPIQCVTWLQAQQACGNSRKRLPSNAEWQLAVAGTPEGAAGDNGTTDCNTGNVLQLVNTGSRSGCVSNYGVFDMVGNVAEWVADWAPLSTTCSGWGTFSNDINCFAGASTAPNTGPGALVRGGDLGFGSGDGPLYVRADAPLWGLGYLGFRCAR